MQAPPPLIGEQKSRGSINATTHKLINFQNFPAFPCSVTRSLALPPPPPPPVEKILSIRRCFSSMTLTDLLSLFLFSIRSRPVVPGLAGGVRAMERRVHGGMEPGLRRLQVRSWMSNTRTMMSIMDHPCRNNGIKSSVRKILWLHDQPPPMQYLVVCSSLHENFEKTQGYFWNNGENNY